MTEHTEKAENWEQYVERVGTLFAVAIARDQVRKYQAKAARALEAYQRLGKLLESHFDNNEETEQDDEPLFDCAFQAYITELRKKANAHQQMEDEAIRLGKPGTSPGQQESLTSLGITIPLDDIRRELESPGIH